MFALDLSLQVKHSSTTESKKTCVPTYRRHRICLLSLVSPSSSIKKYDFHTAEPHTSPQVMDSRCWLAQLVFPLQTQASRDNSLCPCFPKSPLALTQVFFFSPRSGQRESKAGKRSGGNTFFSLFFLLKGGHYPKMKVKWMRACSSTRIWHRWAQKKSKPVQWKPSSRRQERYPH